MPTISVSDQQLAESIEIGLSQPPSSAGRRLRSERDLAALFSASHSTVRRSLDRLVKQGVLVRRHGSGTYVRRVPVIQAKAGKTGAPTVEPHMLFATPPLNRSELTPTRQQQQLELGLWVDFTRNAGPARQAVLNAIVSRAEEAGHRLTIHSLFDRLGRPWSVDELSRRLKESPSDGYIVAAWWAELFNDAIADAGIPTVYFQDSLASITYEPIVFVDTHEAISRAVRLLAAESHERIAMIGLDIPDEPTDPFTRTYGRAIEDAGLNYQAAEFSPPVISEAIATTRRLLGGDNPPQAIYVTDDVIFTGVAEAMKIDGIVPGRDLAVITYATTNYPLPTGVNWSRLQFDFEYFGELIVGNLLRLIQTAGTRVSSNAIHAVWRPGDTHMTRPTSSRKSHSRK